MKVYMSADMNVQVRLTKKSEKHCFRQVLDLMCDVTITTVLSSLMPSQEEMGKCLFETPQLY